MTALRIKACGLSDVGLTRAHNEDYFEIDPMHRLYVVADGMGGHSHGEVASQIAVNTIRDYVAKTSDKDTTWPLGMDVRLERHSNLLKMAVRAAHDQVLRAISKDGSLYGMGTTVVGLLIAGQTVAVAHVGDSRAYRLRGDRLEQLTQDHTWVNEQVVAGFLSKEQARSHPLKNVVTRALGGESDVLVDVRELEVRTGDLFLLCSDGLTGMLSDADIRDRLSSGRSLHEICRTLINDANARGGIDNVTVVLLSAEEDAGRDGDSTR
ncbi:MAG TPA: Stp1/IreP family PP2C-type Ser/Thr phosphatase [Thermoanaerobaculia bacterium]|jgi:protein phosphatase|nr:Stp1/IreP family PP2C-type Ser/Thr phosphatase [Thermoanaerobaculia bacterium]